MDFGPNTTVDDATVALVAAIMAALDPSVQVYDGPPHKFSEPNYVIVNGWEMDERRPASFGGPGRFSIEETYVLLGEVVTNTGGTETARAARQAALSILVSIEAAIRQDPTLGGAVTAAFLEKFDGRTEGSGHGLSTRIPIEVRCTARVS